MLYIGVDLGTSAVKLLLMNETGKIEKIVQGNILCIFQSPAGLSKIRRLVETELRGN